MASFKPRVLFWSVFFVVVFIKRILLNYIRYSHLNIQCFFHSVGAWIVNKLNLGRERNQPHIPSPQPKKAWYVTKGYQRKLSLARYHLMERKKRKMERKESVCVLIESEGRKGRRREEIRWNKGWRREKCRLRYSKTKRERPRERETACTIGPDSIAKGNSPTAVVCGCHYCQTQDEKSCV